MESAIIKTRIHDIIHFTKLSNFNEQFTKIFDLSSYEQLVTHYDIIKVLDDPEMSEIICNKLFKKFGIIFVDHMFYLCLKDITYSFYCVKILSNNELHDDYKLFRRRFLDLTQNTYEKYLKHHNNYYMIFVLIGYLYTSGILSCKILNDIIFNSINYIYNSKNIFFDSLISLIYLALSNTEGINCSILINNIKIAINNNLNVPNKNIICIYNIFNNHNYYHILNGLRNTNNKILSKLVI